jgi:probable F420-dependent oxidoreductase
MRSGIWTGVGLAAAPVPLSFADQARAVDRAGFDGAWLGDHVVLVDRPASRYPYSEDGRFHESADDDWYDWAVTLAHLSAVTPGLRLGVGVCVVALRHPLTLAKQLATLDRLSGGAVVLGAGTGWLAEEFAALGVPFAGRGDRTDAALELMRAAWTGAPAPGSYGPFDVPAGIRVHPRPVTGAVPVLVAGDSARAMRRAVTWGDGWMAVANHRRSSVADVGRSIGRLRAVAEELGRDPGELTVALRVPAGRSSVEGPAFADYLHGLVAAGATGMVFDLSWRHGAETADLLAWLAATVAGLPAPDGGPPGPWRRPRDPEETP